MAEKVLGFVDEHRLGIVDTPGWSLLGLANSEQVKQEILRSARLTSYGLRTYLLIIPVDSFKKKDRRAVEEHVDLLGDSTWHHTIVVFTWGDLLRGKSIEKHIEQMGEPLQWVLRKCNNRYHVISNKTACDCSQVSHLLQLSHTLQTSIYPTAHVIPRHILNIPDGVRSHWRGRDRPTDASYSIEMINNERWRHMNMQDLYQH